MAAFATIASMAAIGAMAAFAILMFFLAAGPPGGRRPPPAQGPSGKATHATGVQPQRRAASHMFVSFCRTSSGVRKPRPQSGETMRRSGGTYLSTSVKRHSISSTLSTRLHATCTEPTRPY
eukprot:NODE_25703_length_578_cov_1.403548.p2 GENE.NODE_25703_length_578_cov_1.403548~~NODE_25703_length_578_cov_1.403548.p2  ORF type:complete len:121 (-),score=5.32 NODE_25703_length_578_cov_1.403548:106-468(-)